MKRCSSTARQRRIDRALDDERNLSTALSSEATIFRAQRQPG